MVYVLNQDKKPLMPCSNARARLLLKKNYAKVIKKYPFTIKLEHFIEDPIVKELTLGIDTGSNKLGSAVTDNDNNIYYQSEITIRNDIRSNMDRRRSYRRTRRFRKTRYRKARFLNRRNSIKKNRFSPTMTSKINSHHKEINFVKSLLPISKLIIETGKFDPHLMKDPSLYYGKWGYAKGSQYGYSNFKEYVKARDNYTCQLCKKTNTLLEVHHIIYRTNGGSNIPTNLITLCSNCHSKVHNNLLTINKKVVNKSLKHATQMNSIRVQLLKYYSNAIETFGYITKVDRLNLGLLNKEHYNDAVAISCLDKTDKPLNYLNKNILIKKCIPYRDIRKTKGVRSETPITTSKILGFRRYDKVRYLNNEYFIKGRMSTGYAILMDIYENKIILTKGPKTAKLSNCIRLNSRKSWMISENHM